MQGTMVTEVEWKAANPGIDILIQEVGLVLVDVHPVTAAPYKGILRVWSGWKIS